LIEIIPYNDKYAEVFFSLNIEWLETYFYVEKHDRDVLSNPKSYIIDNGGFIFFAKYNNEIVGTFALMNETEGFELSKMAVSPKYRGLKIGQKMMDYCIDFSRNKKWDKLLLYSNRKLENAIYIYKKYGFVEVELETDSPYERSDIKMVMEL
jgi:ribosomal protein S18 acetylase RimI-like enzyme